MTDDAWLTVPVPTVKVRLRRQISGQVTLCLSWDGVVAIMIAGRGVVIMMTARR